MTKIVKMSEKNEHGTLEQFYPETHAEAVKGLVSVSEEEKTIWIKRKVRRVQSKKQTQP